MPLLADLILMTDNIAKTIVYGKKIFWLSKWSWDKMRDSGYYGQWILVIGN
jgi:hypothetical protein